MANIDPARLLYSQLLMHTREQLVHINNQQEQVAQQLRQQISIQRAQFINFAINNPIPNSLNNPIPNPLNHEPVIQLGLFCHVMIDLNNRLLAVDQDRLVYQRTLRDVMNVIKSEYFAVVRNFNDAAFLVDLRQLEGWTGGAVVLEHDEQGATLLLLGDAEIPILHVQGQGGNPN